MRGSGLALDDRENVASRKDEVLDTVLLARTPLKRLVDPEEVADAVAFLCSPAATSVTGTSLMLDGGWSAA